MANIHGLGDYNSTGGAGRGFGGGPPRGDQENPQGMFGILTGNPGGDTKRPREYQPWDFWTTTFCPNFELMSFPCIMWLIITVIFLATLISCAFLPNANLNSYLFLGVNPAFLNTLQAMNPYEVRYNYQLWRPFTSLLLTPSLQQWGYSTAYLLIFGCMLHATKMSFVRMCAFWFICGGIGNWFGSVCNSEGPLTVGSNPGNFALWGGVIACFIVNWKKLDSMA